MILDAAGIARLLPHGHPMVLVDRVVELVPGESLVAEKAVSVTEACYAPARSGARDYAYPAGLLIESFGQAAALLWLYTAKAGDGLPMFAAARDVVLHGSAYPGDVLRHAVRLDHGNAGSAIASGETWAGGRHLLSFGSMTAVVKPYEALPRPDRPVRGVDR